MTSTLDGFTLGRTLGSGFSAKVKLGTSQDGSEYALKIFRLDNPEFNDKAFKLLKEEVEATTQLDHKHVVKYFQFKESANMIKKSGQAIEVAYIAQEMIGGGELFNYVANSGPFTEDICKYYFKQMLQGVHYIHSQGFTHRDLKLENILVDKMYDIKIVDFGFAVNLEGRDGSGKNRTCVGTPGFMAPEILESKPYQGEVIDLFALGVILFTLFAGHPPFAAHANDEDPYYKLITSNRADLFWRAHSNPNQKPEGFFPEEFKDLITCMLQYNPYQRLCMADIIAHPWMASGNCASPEAVRSEFANREEVNKQQALAEAERKQAARASANNGPRRDFALDGKVYLSHGDFNASPENASAEVIRLNVKDFNANKNLNQFAFFSTDRPEKLFEQLAQKMNEQRQEFKVSGSTWKLTFEVSKQVNEATEGETEFVPQYTKCKVKVEILKVPDQEKFCVDFSREAGSSILFCERANQYIDHLDIYNNTTLDADAE